MYTYADAEALVAVWIEAVLADVRAMTDTPLDLLALLADLRGICVVSAFGGFALNPAQDRVHLDLDWFVGPDAGGEPDRAAASDLARDGRAAMLAQLPGYSTADGATVQFVTEMSRPTERPWDESPIRRFSAAYRLVVATRG